MPHSARARFAGCGRWAYIPAIAAVIAVVGTPSLGRAQGTVPAPGARAYEPTLQSLRRHAVPAWFNDAKLGIFVHWGLYSVPAYAVADGPVAKEFKQAGLPGVIKRFGWSGWFTNNPYAEWYENSLRLPGSPTRAYHDTTYGTGATYAAFRPLFDSATTRWDPAQMAALFKRAGARYVVLTTKHHDGFVLWPSRTPNPRQPAWQARRDIVGDLSTAVRAADLRMGLYYSGGLDWTFAPGPITSFESMLASVPQDSAYARYAEAQVRELIDRYRPSVLWNDISWPRASSRDALFADYYNRVPDGVVNNRFIYSAAEFAPPAAGAAGPPARHYDFTTPEYAVESKVLPTKWEATRGIGLSFGYNRTEDAAAFLSVDELVDSFVDIVSKNGNLLLNVGPAADGSISAGQRERLEGLGAWLAANGAAIYGTRPWVQAEATATDETGRTSRVRFTQKGDAVYAVLLDTPRGRRVTIPMLGRVGAGRQARVTLLATGARLEAAPAAGRGLTVTLPAALEPSAAHALRIQPAAGRAP